MATSRPFAYNPSRTPISGTEQVGDLAIAVEQQYYSEGLGGVRWWMGPDEDPGYIICYPFSAGTKPSPDGNIAYLGFKRSQFKTEESFVAMANAFADGQATFSNGLDAYLWLNLNGNWTSYIPVTPTPTPTPTQTQIATTPTMTSTQARTAFSVFYGPSYGLACPSTSGTTIYGENPTWSSNTQFYNNSTGPVTIDMSNFYNYLGEVIELNSLGQFVSGVLLCPTPTPTNTPTNTETPTNTPTVTPTPNIVTTGLVMQLDANNILSYSGGTTVYDLTGSYDNSLLNGASFTTLNGIKCFDCSTGNNLIQVNSTGPSLPTSGYTYVGWSKIIPSSATWRTLFRTNNNIPILTESGTDNLGYYNFTFQDSGYDVTSIQDVWAQYAVVGDNVSSDFYINGSLVGNVAYGAGGDIHVMWGNNLLGAQPFGYLANLYFYDRKLSLSEINQMYNFLSPNFVELTPTPTPTETQIAPTPTPTETQIAPTPTPTETQIASTPTNTPTPSVTPSPVTGYSFNLVALPYNFPTSGNSIMNGPAGVASTDPNALATGARGFYFNSIDSDSIDRTNYFSTFTGQSVTITLSQTGSTAIYSGDTNSFKQWIQSPMGSGFVFGAGIGVPPTNTPSGTAVLIQSATTQFTIGLPVYVSLIQN